MASSSNNSKTVDDVEWMKTRVKGLNKHPWEFDPKSVASWNDGERVPFMFLSLVFNMISQEPEPISVTNIVCNMLITVVQTTPEDLLPVIYLCAHRGFINIENQNLVFDSFGELALGSSQTMMHNEPTAPLTVAKVFDTFCCIAKESGMNILKERKNHVLSLLAAATDCETQYLIRLLQAKSWIGLAEQTLLTALGRTALYFESHSIPLPHIKSLLEEGAKIVKQVYSALLNYHKMTPNLFALTPGVPVGLMLARPTKSVSKILDRYQCAELICEYKYDGERAQIHYLENSTVEIYSRNAERITEKFPEVVVEVSRLKKLSITSFILDCELVPYDREVKIILPFKFLGICARNEVSADLKIGVCIFAFDILYLNGQQLIQEQLRVRREHLYNSFKEEPGYFQFATAIIPRDPEEIQTFFKDSVDSSCEGLIIKTLDRVATYDLSNRSNSWMKLKKNYRNSIGDSLDLVPIAAFYSRGRRIGGYRFFLLACYDSDRKEFQSICKLDTGYNGMLRARSHSLLAKVITKPKSYYRYGDRINPDVWFEPTEVWEVKAADLRISRLFQAATGIVHPHKGISCGFPRLIRIRQDKIPEQASSSEQVVEMYDAQKRG